MTGPRRVVSDVLSRKSHSEGGGVVGTVEGVIASRRLASLLAHSNPQISRILA